jgi:hypothetical protein
MAAARVDRATTHPSPVDLTRFIDGADEDEKRVIEIRALAQMIPEGQWPRFIQLLSACVSRTSLGVQFDLWKKDGVIEALAELGSGSADPKTTRRINALLDGGELLVGVLPQDRLSFLQGEKLVEASNLDFAALNFAQLYLAHGTCTDFVETKKDSAFWQASHGLLLTFGWQLGRRMFPVDPERYGLPPGDKLVMVYTMFWLDAARQSEGKGKKKGEKKTEKKSKKNELLKVLSPQKQKLRVSRKTDQQARTAKKGSQPAVTGKNKRGRPSAASKAKGSSLAPATSQQEEDEEEEEEDVTEEKEKKEKEPEADEDDAEEEEDAEEEPGKEKPEPLSEDKAEKKETAGEKDQHKALALGVLELTSKRRSYFFKRLLLRGLPDTDEGENLVVDAHMTELERELDEDEKEPTEEETALLDTFLVSDQQLLTMDVFAMRCFLIIFCHMATDLRKACAWMWKELPRKEGEEEDNKKRDAWVLSCYTFFRDEVKKRHKNQPQFFDALNMTLCPHTEKAATMGPLSTRATLTVPRVIGDADRDVRVPLSQRYCQAGVNKGVQVRTYEKDPATNWTMTQFYRVPYNALKNDCFTRLLEPVRASKVNEKEMLKTYEERKQMLEQLSPTVVKSIKNKDKSKKPTFNTFYRTDAATQVLDKKMKQEQEKARKRMTKKVKVDPAPSPAPAPAPAPAAAPTDMEVDEEEEEAADGKAEKKEEKKEKKKKPPTTAAEEKRTKKKLEELAKQKGDVSVYTDSWRQLVTPLLAHIVRLFPMACISLEEVEGKAKAKAAGKKHQAQQRILIAITNLIASATSNEMTDAARVCTTELIHVFRLMSTAYDQEDTDENFLIGRVIIEHMTRFLAMPPMEPSTGLAIPSPFSPFLPLPTPSEGGLLKRYKDEVGGKIWAPDSDLFKCTELVPRSAFFHSAKPAFYHMVKYKKTPGQEAQAEREERAGRIKEFHKKETGLKDALDKSDTTEILVEVVALMQKLKAPLAWAVVVFRQFLDITLPAMAKSKEQHGEEKQKKAVKKKEATAAEKLSPDAVCVAFMRAVSTQLFPKGVLDQVKLCVDDLIYHRPPRVADDDPHKTEWKEEERKLVHLCLVEGSAASQQAVDAVVAAAAAAKEGSREKKQERKLPPPPPAYEEMLKMTEAKIRSLVSVVVDVAPESEDGGGDGKEEKKASSSSSSSSSSAAVLTPKQERLLQAFFELFVRHPNEYIASRADYLRTRAAVELEATTDILAKLRANRKAIESTIPRLRSAWKEAGIAQPLKYSLLQAAHDV